MNAAHQRTVRTMEAITLERASQRIRWGDQSYLPNDTGPDRKLFGWPIETLIHRCRKWIWWRPNWFMILFREVLLVRGEGDPTKLRERLVRVAAVAVAWIEKLDREEVVGLELGRRADAGV